MKNLGFYYILLFSVFISTLLFTKKLIPKLKMIAKQPIYGDGPSWHMKKSGTPTMGGIGFIIPSLSLVVVAAILNFSLEYTDVGTSLLISLAFCLLNAIVGIWDDITKIMHSRNAGLTPRQKLMLQTLIAIAFLAVRKFVLRDDTRLFLGEQYLDLGFLYYPLALLFILGIVNCANLTDGVDGLEASVSFSIAIFTFLISIGKSTDAWALSAIGIGATLGFLAFNIHPAKIFMGDTGSLFLGALCVCYAFSLKSLPAYILVGGVYVIEGVSVIAQVTAFKTTGKRILKMAPLHHHMEKCGFDENKICIYAILATFVLSAMSLVLFGGVR